ncbi:GNAT family N-acetyltransferase [Rhodohalobacter sp. SW132]|uniref:GNAT family N-acetyltransferase n=1 Tax=Rhodohalobacter sp. SW132 TaxID=2293433 RepID=UPI000E21DA43|nr:GNAT family N-acetyltransferase [Rhodohalobacter sp. SW132]REL24734.1 GNAT family N-acetyltransferase [Rhodohalobacter sp. SW132]
MTPKIRHATDEDKKMILDLLNKVFSSQQRSENLRDDRYWKWKFIDSVFGDSILTVADVNGEIVGFDHLWPWEFCYGDQIVKAVQPCDAVVDEKYRGKGLFKRMRNFGLAQAEKKGIQFAFNFPNMNSLPGNRSIGAKYLGKITWWVKILHPLNIVMGAVSDKKSKALDMPDHYTLKPDFLDELALSTRTEINSIQIHRKKRFHHWRYLEHPTRSYGMIRVKVKKKSTAIIFTVNQKGSTREMVVVDIVGDNIQKSEIVKYIVKAGRDVKADFIAVIDNHEYRLENLWMNGFIKKKLKNMVVFPLNSKYAELAGSYKNWTLMAGMHDSI